MAPLLHRFLHKFHLEISEEDKGRAKKRESDKE
jgi:hypothetical protein